jgi:hypothetical protein
LLIVPGASGLPEFYDPFVEAVAARGYDIKALHIPSVGLVTGAREGPLPTMYDDAEFIAKHVRELADLGNDVILITHSYGGTPATESVKGLSKKERQRQGLQGGIIGIAYMTSLVPNVGGSAGTVKAAFPSEEKVPMAIDVCFTSPVVAKATKLTMKRKMAGSTTQISQRSLSCRSRTCPKMKANSGLQS